MLNAMNEIEIEQTECRNVEEIEDEEIKNKGHFDEKKKLNA